MPPRPAEHVPALDGLRGIAILLVLARHAARPFPEGTSFVPLAGLGGWDAFTPALNGWMGVDLFFVLSGFLIAGHLRHRWDHEPSPARAYLARRALRIVPAYYACLALVLAGAFPGDAVDAGRWGWRVLYHILFMQDYWPADIVVAFWSLGVEAKFYLAAPLVLVPLRGAGRGTAVAVLAGLALMPLGIRTALFLGGGPLSGYAEYFLTLRSPFYVAGDGLWLGALAAVLADAAPVALVRHARRLAAAGVALSLVLLGSRRWLETIGWFEATLMGALVALGFTAWLLGVALEPEGPLSPRAGWLSFLARISYSLYLVHLPLAGPAYTWLMKHAAFAALPAGAQVLVSGLAYSSASLLAALVLHHAVERPFLRKKAGIGRRLSDGSPGDSRRDRSPGSRTAARPLP